MYEKYKDLDIIIAPGTAVRLVLALETAIEAIKEMRLDAAADVGELKDLQASLHKAIIKLDTGEENNA